VPAKAKGADALGIPEITLARVFDPLAIGLAVLGGWRAHVWWQFLAVGIGAEFLVEVGLSAALPDYYVFRPAVFAISALTTSAWACLAHILASSPGARLRLAKFQRTKAYDLVAALPLIAWYAYGLRNQAPLTGLRLNQLVAGNIDLQSLLQLIGLLGTFLLTLLIIVLLLARKTPMLKAKGLLPRAVAVAGTFLGNGFLHLKAANLSLPVQALADVLIIGSAAGAIIALLSLRTAFSIMPEARQLVTSGPYAAVRHPLYTAELIGFLGLALQFQQPWAALLGVALFGLQYWRTMFEEKVLSEAYPDYAAYRARTSRFVPYVF
jgi:protein-S-isoprenylcysteine O-methyltransferase Ste14